MPPNNLVLGDCRPMTHRTILDRLVVGKQFCGLTNCEPIAAEKTDDAVGDDDIGFL